MALAATTCCECHFVGGSLEVVGGRRDRVIGCEGFPKVALARPRILLCWLLSA